MLIEPCAVQFLSEIILVTSNQTRAARSFDFEITRTISDQIAQMGFEIPLSDEAARVFLRRNENFANLSLALKRKNQEETHWKKKAKGPEKKNKKKKNKLSGKRQREEERKEEEGSWKGLMDISADVEAEKESDREERTRRKQDEEAKPSSIGEKRAEERRKRRLETERREEERKRGEEEKTRRRRSEEERVGEGIDQKKGREREESKRTKGDRGGRARRKRETIERMLSIPEYIAHPMRVTRSYHSSKFNNIGSNSNTYKYDFFTSTLKEWNILPSCLLDQPSVDDFKSAMTNYFSLSH